MANNLKERVRFVVGMNTRKPFAVEIVEVILDAGTNGVALKRALAIPEVTADFAPEHVGIVRSDTVSHIRKDLDRFCLKVGVTDELERAKFVVNFADTMIEMLNTVRREEKEAGDEIPLSQSRWGKGVKNT